MGLHENTVMMRSLIATLLLVPLSALAQTQVPNVFEDGTPASAAEVNENFQYVLENASGGCSATQQDNSVLIECADGTSGVIAGAGTVVMYPEGTTGTVPDLTTIPNGDFVIKDTNDVILGEYWNNSLVPNWFRINLRQDKALIGVIGNDPATQTITLTATGAYSIYFVTDDCTGNAFLAEPFRLHDFGDDGLAIASLGNSSGTTIFYSSKASAYWDGSQVAPVSECRPESAISDMNVAVPYTAAPEILNAAYPVRVEQLP